MAEEDLALRQISIASTVSLFVPFCVGRARAASAAEACWCGVCVGVCGWLVLTAGQISADEYDFSDQEDFSQPEEAVGGEDEEVRCLTLEELAQDQLEAIDDVNSIFEVCKCPSRPPLLGPLPFRFSKNTQFF